ncbi:PAS domain S-box protein [uncultured Methanospirillum sp.]|uniref:PAS domain S-box protein n=1 Tax=uncultured Methanospirillum sp. TaxID=262503 RepID=UPI0029C87763|nr:PAS domain S-box protein [uncultured Methanospirillum sp.]
MTDRKKAESDLISAYDQIATSEEELRQNYENLEKSEQKISESEQRLYDIINFLPDSTFAIDEKGIVIAWNRAIEDISGVQAENILGKSDHEYSLPFYGERRPILIDIIFEDVEVILSQYDTVNRVGNWLIAETFIVGAYQGKGAYLWGIASPLYDTNGKIVGDIESIRDISIKKWHSMLWHNQERN